MLDLQLAKITSSFCDVTARVSSFDSLASFENCWLDSLGVGPFVASRFPLPNRAYDSNTAYSASCPGVASTSIWIERLAGDVLVESNSWRARPGFLGGLSDAFTEGVASQILVTSVIRSKSH